MAPRWMTKSEREQEWVNRRMNALRDALDLAFAAADEILFEADRPGTVLDEASVMWIRNTVAVLSAQKNQALAANLSVRPSLHGTIEAAKLRKEAR